MIRSTASTVEDLDEGGTYRPSNDRPSDEEIREGDWGERRLPDSTKKLLDSMFGDEAKSTEVAEGEDADEQEADVIAGGATEVQAGDAPAEPAKAAAPTPPEDWKTQLETTAAERTRYETANKALLSELEELKKQPARKAASALLEEAGSEYIDNSKGSLRKLIANAFGLDDPNHADVTAELSALANDLTSELFGVQLDTAQQASREAAKARQALARDKRERKAESDANANKATATAETSQAEQSAAFIGNRLSQARDGKALREQFPLTMALAERVDGMSPEKLIWTVYQRESKLGRYDQARSSDDDYLITETARLIETHYQALADAVAKAKPLPSTSTATTEQAGLKPDAQESARKDQRQSHGARTLTQAAASVAPATQPAVKTKTEKAKPKAMPSRKDVLGRHFKD